MKQTFSDMVLDLTKSYDELEQACSQLMESILADTGRPFILPTYCGAHEMARSEAAKSLTHFRRTDDDILSAGLLSASTETINAAHEVNQKKKAFQAVIRQLRSIAAQQSDKTRLDRLIDITLKKDGIRTDAIHLALHRLQLNNLDLVRCYASIRILPAHLKSVSWTWAKTHSSILSISHKEACEMAMLLPPEQSSVALSLLRLLPPNERLAYKKNLKNQLRANISWVDHGQLRKKLITISGIALSQDLELPKHIWRGEHAMNEHRLVRSDKHIDTTPYVRALHLYRYITPVLK